MSNESDCKSPSIDTTISPCDNLKPAARAAVCPQFFLKIIGLTYFFSFAIESRISLELSVLPSSMKRNS